MRVGLLNRQVTLARSPQATNDADGYWEALSPATVWCAIEPVDAGGSDDTRIQNSRVTIRFHKQVTVDVRLTYSDPVLNRDRKLFVRGVQNVNDGNHTMVLLCEEVIP